MRPLLTIVLICASVLCANAQLSLLTGAGGKFKSGGGAPPPTYVGPGDVAPGAVAWWGLRAYNAAKVGTNAVRLREDGGNTEQNFSTIAGGGLNLAAIAAFKGANNLFVVTLYDQTGSGFDATQATAGNQPPFTLGFIGSLPVVGGGSGKWLETASSPAVSQPLTVSWVARDTDSTVPQTVFGGGVGVDFLSGFADGPNMIYYYAGSVVDTSGGADGALHAVQILFNGASSKDRVDSVTSGATDPGAGDLSVGSVRLGSDAFSQYLIDGVYGEAGLWSGDQSATWTAMNSNQRAYWGTP